MYIELSLDGFNWSNTWLGFINKLPRDSQSERDFFFIFIDKVDKYFLFDSKRSKPVQITASILGTPFFVHFFFLSWGTRRFVLSRRKMLVWVYRGVRTCELFVAIVRVRIYYLDFYIWLFFVLHIRWVLQVFTPRMSRWYLVETFCVKIQILLFMFLLPLFSLCWLLAFLPPLCCSWRPQPGFYADGQDVDDTISEPHSSVPCSPPKMYFFPYFARDTYYMANLSTIKMRVVIGSVSDPNFAIRNIVLRLTADKFVQGKLTAFFFSHSILATEHCHENVITDSEYICWLWVEWESCAFDVSVVSET